MGKQGTFTFAKTTDCAVKRLKMISHKRKPTSVLHSFYHRMYSFLDFDVYMELRDQMQEGNSNGIL